MGHERASFILNGSKEKGEFKSGVRIYIARLHLQDNSPHIYLLAQSRSKSIGRFKSCQFCDDHERK